MKRSVAIALGVAAVALGGEARADDKAPPPSKSPVPPAPVEAAAAPNDAPKLLVEAGAVVLVRGEQRTTLVPAGAVAARLLGTKAYVALGAQGAAVFDVADSAAPKLVGRAENVDGKVTGFHQVGEELWMEIETRRAVPAPAANGVVPLPAPAEAAPRAPEGSAAPGRPTEPQAGAATARAIAILAVTPGEVELDAGKAEGIAVGDKLAVFRTRPASSDRSDYVNRERVAVVEVYAVREHSALAEVGRGARIVVGDAIERAKPDESDSLVYPKRLARLVDFQATLRPLVNVGTPLGGGVLIDGSATYLGNGYFAGARLHPLGIGGTKDGGVISSSVLAEAGYDARPFAVGLGLGVSAANGDLDSLLGYNSTFDSSGNPISISSTQRTNTAFTVGQVVRLGARDGLNFSLVNVLLFHKKPDTGESGFIYGATTGRLNIPLMQSTDLFAEGGGGFMGYAYGALGVHTWLVGRGDAGSLALSVAAGGAGVWGSRQVTVTPTDIAPFTTTERVSIGGPMASIGFQYRMGL